MQLQLQNHLEKVYFYFILLLNVMLNVKPKDSDI